jgi:hypothetical protein
MFILQICELNEASIGLGLRRIDHIDNSPHLEVRDLKKWVMDVYYHPIKYVKIIRQIRDIYNSQHKYLVSNFSRLSLFIETYYHE